MTEKWDSPENASNGNRPEFCSGRIVARMPDLDDCQPIQQTHSSTREYRGVVVRLIQTRFLNSWRILARFRKPASPSEGECGENSQSEREASKKRFLFTALIAIGILCIVLGGIIGGVVLHKEHKKAKKREMADKAAAVALEKKEAAEKAAKEKAAKAAADKAAAKTVAAKPVADKEVVDKAAADKAAAVKAAAEKAAAEKAAAAKIAAAKAAAEKAAAEKAAAEKAAADKVAAAKAAAAKAVAEKAAPQSAITEKKTAVAPTNNQSPWDRPATEGYSPWGMASTRQVNAQSATQNVPQPPTAAVQMVQQPAIPMAQGTLVRQSQGTVNAVPQNYSTAMVAPATGVTSYRPYAPPAVSQPQQGNMGNMGRVPVAESALTYQNISGVTGSGHYVPSAVHELSMVASQGMPTQTPMPMQTPAPVAAPNAIRPLGPIPSGTPVQGMSANGAVPQQTNQPYVQNTGSPTMVAATAYPPQGSAVNYQTQPNYQQQAGYQPQPNYQQQAGYQPQPNYQQQAGYQPQPNYQPQNGYQPQPNNQSTSPYASGKLY